MRRRRLFVGGALTLLILITLAGSAPAYSGRIGLHALRIEPRGEAKNLSDPSYGVGLELVAPRLAGLAGHRVGSGGRRGGEGQGLQGGGGERQEVAATEGLGGVHGGGG